MNALYYHGADVDYEFIAIEYGNAISDVRGASQVVEAVNAIGRLSRFCAARYEIICA